MKSLTRTTFTKLFWYDLASVCKGFSGCLFFYVKAWISYRPARAKAREREKRETFPSENINGKLNISKDVTSYSRGEFTTSDQLVYFPSCHFFTGRRSYGYKKRRVLRSSLQFFSFFSGEKEGSSNVRCSISRKVKCARLTGVLCKKKREKRKNPSSLSLFYPVKYWRRRRYSNTNHLWSIPAMLHSPFKWVWINRPSFFLPSFPSHFENEEKIKNVTRLVARRDGRGTNLSLAQTWRRDNSFQVIAFYTFATKKRREEIHFRRHFLPLRGIN